MNECFICISCTLCAGVVSTVAGGGSTGYVDGVGAVARFYLLWGMTSLSNGDLVVADSGNHMIRRATSSG